MGADPTQRDATRPVLKQGAFATHGTRVIAVINLIEREGRVIVDVALQALRITDECTGTHFGAAGIRIDAAQPQHTVTGFNQMTGAVDRAGVICDRRARGIFCCVSKF